MTTYKDVDEGLKQVIDYLESIRDVWSKPRNLKLHKVAMDYMAIIDDFPLVKEEYKEDDVFSLFLEDEYNNFTEWMEENNITDCREYRWGTSTFDLTDIDNDVIGNVIDALLYKVYGYYPIDINDKGEMIPFEKTDYYTEKEQIEEHQEPMTYIASGDFLKEIKSILHDAVEIANYIDSFKEKQIDIFKNYVSFLNEQIEWQKEQDEKEEKAFTDKYAGFISDLTETIEAMIRDSGCTLAEARRIIGKSFDNITLDGITEANTQVG